MISGQRSSDLERPFLLSKSMIPKAREDLVAGRRLIAMLDAADHHGGGAHLRDGEDDHVVTVGPGRCTPGGGGMADSRRHQ